uniref:NADH-ubiquinone oxidoreductase chain 4 n=1 Tax=Chaoborus sp. ZK-2019 TaxID=2527953 RepID=A0A411NHG5_9DIPT|nr:NADH dehydrogenase subunit 4 [Chaoborus sp. ZK-2019]
MLKIYLYLGFLCFSCLLKKNFWMGQNLMFFLMFLMIFMFKLDFSFVNLSYCFGIDVMSYGLILLTLWICSLMILASSFVLYKNFFLMMVYLLTFFLVLTFSSMNLFLFYLFFEMSIIPTLLLILGWGYQPERLQAGIYLLFYTMFGSLPLLLGVFYLMINMGSLSLVMIMNFSFMQFFLYMSFIFAFLVKMPMFFVHLWLPKAHVEAPVSGSMILAGILLKLGGYGILRVIAMFQKLGLSLNFILVSTSLFGGVLVSLICLRQVDLKSLVAYSSVAHMGLVLGGIMTLNFWGVEGAYMMMIAHGLCSSGLFCLVNLLYERVGSRSLLLNKGMLNFLPSLAIWWFLLCSCNMAAPPSINLMSEIMLLNSLVSWSWLSILCLSLMSFFSAAYSLYLYSYSQHGQMFSGIFSFLTISCSEFLLLFLHWVPINLLILKCDVIVNWL